MKKGTIIAALVLLSGCAGLHPPANMSLDTALKVSTICKQINEDIPVLSTDIWGASTVLGYCRVFVKDSKHADCLRWYNFNRDKR